jgi:hypothetical protein
MTEEIKFPRPVTEYHRITIGRQGHRWAVFGRIYTDTNGAPVTRGRDYTVANFSDELLCETYYYFRVEALFDKVMQLKKLAHAMRGD